MLWVIHEQDTPGDPCHCPVPWATLRRQTWQDGVLTARGGHSSILWLCLCQEEWTFCQPRGRGSSGDPSVCPDAWDRAASTLPSVTCSVHSTWWISSPSTTSKLRVFRSGIEGKYGWGGWTRQWIFIVYCVDLFNEHTSYKHIDNWAIHLVECPLLFNKINVLTKNNGAFYFSAIQWYH